MSAVAEAAREFELSFTPREDGSILVHLAQPWWREREAFRLQTTARNEEMVHTDLASLLDAKVAYVLRRLRAQIEQANA